MKFEDAPKDLQEIINKAFRLGVEDGKSVKEQTDGQFPRNWEAYGHSFALDHQKEAWNRGFTKGRTGKGYRKNPSI